MNIAIDFLSTELKRIENREPADKAYSALIRKFEKYLSGMGLTITSTLTEVMEKGNHLTVDLVTKKQSNFLNLSDDEFHKDLKKSAKPDEYAAYHVHEIEKRFEELIKGKDGLTKPVIEWDRRAIGYYCLQNHLNLKLEELLHFVFVEFEFGVNNYFADGFSMGQALHELSLGVAQSLFVSGIKRSMKIRSDNKDNRFARYMEEFSQPGESLINYYYTPEYEFDTDAQRIAWLHELGITRLILNRTRDKGGAYNYTKAALILESITNIYNQNIRKSLAAMYNKYDEDSTIYNEKTDDRNNPLRTKKNKEFISKMKEKFGLS